MSSTTLIDRAPSLAESVAQRLRDAITSGRYSVGDQMPTERALAETYGVSRPIIREAMGSLKRDGLISTRQGMRASVTDTREPSPFRFNAVDLRDATEIGHVIELLMAVEATATAHAAERRSAVDLAAIEGRLSAMQEAIDRGDQGVEEDIAFHRTIIVAGRNPFFLEMTEFLDGRVRNFIRTARANTARRDGLVELVQEEHRAIYEAVAAQDAQRARAAAETHLANAASRLATYLAPVP